MDQTNKSEKVTFRREGERLDIFFSLVVPDFKNVIITQNYFTLKFKKIPINTNPIPMYEANGNVSPKRKKPNIRAYNTPI
jgi:hypothetical protein